MSSAPTTFSLCSSWVSRFNKSYFAFCFIFLIIYLLMEFRLQPLTERELEVLADCKPVVSRKPLTIEDELRRAELAAFDAKVQKMMSETLEPPRKIEERKSATATGSGLKMRRVEVRYIPARRMEIVPVVVGLRRIEAKKL